MLNILLISEDANELKDIKDHLNAHLGIFEIEIKADQNEIFDLINRKCPDIILLDYSFQNSSGCEFCNLLKSKFVNRFIPIVLLINKKSFENELKKGLQFGADAFIIKPVDAAELVSVLNMMLRMKSLEDKLQQANEEYTRQVKQTSDELVSKEKRYSEMFDAASNIIILIDKNRKIAEWNKTASQIFEMTKKEVLGKDFESIITNKVMRADINDRFNNKLEPESKSEYQVNIKTRSGLKYQILWAISHLNESNRLYRNILLIGQNVSFRVKQEQERKRSEAKLRSNFLFLNTLLNTLLSPVYYKDTDGKYLGCNVNFANLFGLEPDQIVGKYTQDLNPGPEAQTIIDEDNLVYKTGQKQIKQFSKKYKDGKMRHFIINKTAFYNPDQSIGGLVGVMVDITKIKDMEDALRQSEMFFKGITDSANDAIILTDQKNKVQFWNRAAEGLFGFKRHEIINRDIFETIIPIEEKKRFEHHLSQIMLNKEQNPEAKTIEIRVLTKKGDAFPAEFSNSTILFSKKTSIIFIVKNISLRKQTENILREAKEKAEEADRLKTAFLSNMSHEIRTPMNAIVGFAQLLTSSSISEEKRQMFVDQININSENLLNLIEDIIYVSKIESDQIEIKMGMCLLNSVLDEIYTSFVEHKRRMGKESVEINLVKGNENPNFTILTDIQRFRQILNNLLGNAFKFTEKGLVSFGYKMRDRENLLFFVRDTGLGINPNKINYIFDRFTKIAANKTKLYGGTGLGLSITKHLVEQLGGKIWVESVENKGSIFYFLLPYQSAEQDAFSDIQSKPTSKKMNLENARILIAEDEQMNFLFLREAIHPTGAEILWAKNGREALSFIENNESVNLVLMDMKMPVMDGYEATRKIKKLRPKLPVIAQTAYAMPDEQKKGYEAGCDFYLSKPIDPVLLIDTIKKFLPME